MAAFEDRQRIPAGKLQRARDYTSCACMHDNCTNKKKGISLLTIIQAPRTVRTNNDQQLSCTTPYKPCGLLKQPFFIFLHLGESRARWGC